MELLERDGCITALNSALADVQAGAGRVALVSGEAGIGKTSLVEQFTRQHRPATRVLWGTCDSLFTPRPLGPLHDMSLSLRGTLPNLLGRDANRTAVFAATLEEFQRSVTIAVFEDIHWADEATLDLLRFTGRRIQQTSTLLVLTYRDDELGARHPLRLVLGDLAPAVSTLRVELPPLSEVAVRALIGERRLDAAALHRRTGGNPFYITEVLASTASGIPVSVRDAVLARAARLSAAGYHTLEAAAIIGPRVEPWILTEITGADSKTIEECLGIGMLVSQGNVLAFRHELARQTILAAIPQPTKMALHRNALNILRGSTAINSDSIRLAYHAEGADDRPAVLEFAPQAARQAAAAHAHRESAALYALALRFAEDLSVEDRAQMLEAYAEECNFIDQREEGIQARMKAVELWRQLGQPLREGECLAHLAFMLNGLARTAQAEQASQQALEILQAHPPGRELARAYRTQAGLHMLGQNYQEGIEWAEKAMALAEQYQDAALVISSRNVIGTCMLYLNFDEGCRYLERNLMAADEAGLESLTANAYANLCSVSSELYQLGSALRYLDEGSTYAAERGLERFLLYMQAWQAVTLVRLSRWDEAAEIAHIVLQRPSLSVTSRITALTALGYIYSRRGDAQSSQVLDEALELCRPIGALHRIGLVSAARAEAAWLAGNPEQASAEARAAYDLALSKQHAWFTGELALWRWRGGDRFQAPGWLARPFRLQIAGEWQAAADAWEKLGCAYEQASALADGDTAAQMKAFKLFEKLAARPAMEALLHKLHEAGAVELPRKPRASTLDNPFGLTDRQVEILALLTKGLSNAEIASQLHISVKTADHHVSAVLARLDVHTREAAAEQARQHPHFAK